LTYEHDSSFGGEVASNNPRKERIVYGEEKTAGFNKEGRLNQEKFGSRQPPD